MGFSCVSFCLKQPYYHLLILVKSHFLSELTPSKLGNTTVFTHPGFPGPPLPTILTHYFEPIYCMTDVFVRYMLKRSVSLLEYYFKEQESLSIWFTDLSQDLKSAGYYKAE